MMSDTVGFIRKLPHSLVASFKSTLNVVREADIIIHLIDVSHEYFEDHIKVVEDTLKELNADTKINLKVFNKIDALDNKARVNYITERYPDALFISAERGIGIIKLKQSLLEIYEANYITRTIKLNQNESKKISIIYQFSQVLDVVYEDDRVWLTCRTSSANDSLIKKLIA